MKLLINSIKDLIKSNFSPNWDEYFLTIAHLTSMRSSCVRRRVGALIVKDRRILSLAYNGTPSGYQNCNEGGCPRCNQIVSAGQHLDLCMCLHAEENAIMYVGQKELHGATLYCTLKPCLGCIKKIVQCKISRVVYSDEYNTALDLVTETLCETSGVTLVKMQ